MVIIREFAPGPWLISINEDQVALAIGVFMSITLACRILFWIDPAIGDGDRDPDFEPVAYDGGDTEAATEP